MIELFIDSENADYGNGTSIVKKTIVLASVLIFAASFQWCIMQAFFDGNLIYWRTPMMILSLVLLSIFLAVPQLHSFRLFSVIYMIVTVELLIFGVGLLAVTFGFITLSFMIVCSSFYFYVMIVASAHLDTTHNDPNPFCFLTIFHLNFAFLVMIVYMELHDDPKLMLSMGLLINLYTITAMLIYHSMVVRSGMTRDKEDDYFHMGILYFVDYVCIFLLTAMLFQIDDHKSVNLKICHSL